MGSSINRSRSRLSARTLPALVSLFIFFLTGAVSHAADAPLVRAGNLPAGLPAGIAAPFAESWLAFDGAELLGAPVSPPVQVEGRLTQFFVYGALVQVADGSGEDERYAVGTALADATHDPEAEAQGGGSVQAGPARRSRSILMRRST